MQSDQPLIRWCALVACLAAGAPVHAGGRATRAAAEAILAAHAPSPDGTLRTDLLLVEFRSDFARAFDVDQDVAPSRCGVASVDAHLARVGAVEFRRAFRGTPSPEMAGMKLPDLSGWMAVTIDPTRTSLLAAIEEFVTDPNVVSIQPDALEPVDDVPNDPSYASQWALSRPSDDHDVDAPEGWMISRGANSVTVAVLDTGVRYFHRDLGGVNASLANPGASRGNMAVNYTEINGTPGVDDDHNGYVDDWMGWDFLSNVVSNAWPGEDYGFEDNDPRDFNGHGTHCAGIVGAINNNGYGVASPAGGWSTGTETAYGNGVQVMPLRVGLSVADANNNEAGRIDLFAAAEALWYAANNHARVASLSFGTSNSGGLDAATNYFLAAGGIIFHAAGNDNTTVADYLDSRSDSLIVNVAALDTDDKKAGFSSYGPWVDISAPGVGILSTYHDHANPATDLLTPLSGTSMATPLVASVAANLWSHDLSLTPTQVVGRLLDTADNIDAANPTFLGMLGAGRVNLRRALDDAAGYSVTNPLVFPAGSFVVDTTNAFETVMACDQYSEGHPQIYNSVFIEYRPTASGRCTIDTCGTTWDTKVAVINTWPLACNDDGGCAEPRASRTTFDAIAGDLYIIAVGGYTPSDRGIANLHITLDSASLCANALTLVPIDNYFDTTGATATVLACDQFGQGFPWIYNAIWMKVTASFSGPYRIETCSHLPNFDTKMAVFAGSCGGPIVACNDDSCGFASSVTFDATCGTTYFVALGAYSPGATGHGYLRIPYGGQCTPCPADLDGDRTVGASDLAQVLGAWGGTGIADIDGDGIVGASDLAVLLGAWGACP